MDFDLTREQKILKDSAREFLKKECPTSVIRKMKDDPLGYPEKLWAQMADLGWTGVVIPGKYGGMEGTFLDLCILLETMGGACCPGPFFSTVVLGGQSLLSAGTEKQKENHLTKLASGKEIFGYAEGEPHFWYDAPGVDIGAEKKGEYYILNGTKLFVENAHTADYILCAAHTDTAKPHETGLSLFLVDAKSPGIKFMPLKTMAYDKQFEVVFNQVSVPECNVLGEVCQALNILDKLRQKAAIGKCAEMVGCVQKAFDLTVAYAKDRKQFGRPIGSFQAVQHHCANMVIDVDASRFITYQAAWKISEGLPAASDASMAKAWTGNASRRVTHLAHQIHGAISFTEEYDVHLYYRRAKACATAFGDVDYHLEKVARQLKI